MKKIILYTICLTLLSSCTGINLSSNRWVSGNTFYSDTIPELQIIVNDIMQYETAKKNNRSGENAWGGEASINIKSESYFFVSNGRNLEIEILIDSLTANNWRMLTPDYSASEYPISTGEETLSGLTFNTGVFVVPSGNNAKLVKAYSRLYGKTRLQIFYINHVGIDWLSGLLEYSESKQTYLTEFRKRAKNSFTVSDYDGTLPVSNP